MPSRAAPNMGMNGRLKTLLVVMCCLALPTSAEDPDEHRDMYELVRSRGYAIEKHFQVADDGYILGMFHMPPAGTPNGHVIFLQHALLDSSFSYINNGPGKSLGFILADAGYDVWFGNNRGNTYSRNHTSLSPSDHAFWNFTYSDVALYDLPAQIGAALAGSGAQNLMYIGHSEGTTLGFAGFSSNPTLAEKVTVNVALAPVAYVSHATSPFWRALATTHVDDLLKMFGDSFLPNGYINTASSEVCAWCPVMCDDGIAAMGGKSDHLNLTRLPVYYSQTPAGTSTKNMAHWAQGLRQPVFGEYDYGKDGNLRQYGQETAPQYNLSAISMPTLLVTGSNDVLATPPDVDILLKALPDVSHIDIAGYAHLDMTWAEDAAELLYPQVLAFLKNATVSLHTPSIWV